MSLRENESDAVRWGGVPSEWACGAAGSALPWHGRGRRFDPDQVHHKLNTSVLVCIELQLPPRRWLLALSSQPLALSQGNWSVVPTEGFSTLNLVMPTEGFSTLNLVIPTE